MQITGIHSFSSVELAAPVPEKILSLTRPPLANGLQKLCAKVMDTRPCASNVVKLNKVLMQALGLDALAAVSSINFAYDPDSYYMLLRKGDGWLRRASGPDGAPLYAHCKHPDKSEPAAGPASYNPSNTPWWTAARPGKTVVVGPYNARTTGDEIYTVVLSGLTKSGRQWVIGFDVRTKDVVG